MTVRLFNPRTGEFMDVKVGFSWVLLLFSACLGIPLLLRRLYLWAGIAWTIIIINWLTLGQVGRMPSDMQTFALSSIQGAFLVLSLVMGFRGNELTAKALLEMGWIFADPAAPETAIARQTWRIEEVRQLHEVDVERDIQSAVARQFRR